MNLSLTNSDQQAIIDDADADLVAGISWRLKSDGRGMYYVASTKGSGKQAKTIYLHKLIYGPVKKGYEIHHKNFNPLNCQRGNLEERRKGTHSALVLCL